jgi:putative oxidoreductase
MSLSRRIARPLLGTIFLSSAIPQLKDQSYLVSMIKDAGLSEPELLAKAHVYGNLAGGLGLALGRFPRLAALGLAVNLIPTTIVGHPFWSAPDDQKMPQQINFMKNVSILGGLLLAINDTDGRESVTHAVGRVSKRTARKTAKATAKAKKKLPTS